jgi:hypothetical protein
MNPPPKDPKPAKDDMVEGSEAMEANDSTQEEREQRKANNPNKISREGRVDRPIVAGYLKQSHLHGGAYSAKLAHKVARVAARGEDEQ